MLLSFNTTMKLVSRVDALFNASYAIPPVREPSPMTDTMVSEPPDKSRAFTIPSPADMEVELCPVSKQSQSLSFRLGKPLMPWYFLKVSNPSFLPVRILWV